MKKALLFAGLVLLSLGGCFPPGGVSGQFLHLSVRRISLQTKTLKITVYYCQDGVRVGDPVEREREVRSPLEESFYLPPSPYSLMEVFVRGLHKQSGEVIQHLRLRLANQRGREKLPPLSLQQGAFPSSLSRERYPLCASPLPPEREAPVVSGVRPPPLEQNPKLPPMTHTPPHDPEAREPQPEEPPSRFRLRDRVQSRTPIQWRYPTRGIVASGRLVVVSTVRDNLSAGELAILDAVGGQLLQQIPLPTGCDPQGVDLQGEVVAVACAALNRVFLFEVGSWRPLGGKEGIVVGNRPLALRLSGRFLLVANSGDSTVSVIDLQNLQQAPRTQNVGETPVAIAAVGTQFFVANYHSGSVSELSLDGSEEIHKAVPYSVGPRPLGVSANGWYLVTANSGNNTLTVYDRLRGRQRNITLGGTPHDVRLLSHTALVADKDRPRLYVIDLRTATIEVVPLQTSPGDSREGRIPAPGQLLPRFSLPALPGKIAISGEMILTTCSRQHILRASFVTRPRLLQVRAGASPRQLHLANHQVYFNDVSSQTIRRVDIASGQTEASWSVKGAHWLGGSKEVLLHSGGSGKEVVIRRLDHRLTPLTTTRLGEKLRGGSFLASEALLLHWDDPLEGGLGSPRLTRLDLTDISRNLFQSFTRTLPFLQQPVAVVRITEEQPAARYPKGLLVADYKANALYLLDEAILDGQSSPAVKALRTVNLASSPQAMVKTGHLLTVALANASIVVVDIRDLSVSRPVYLSGQPGGLAAYGDHVLLTDRQNDLLLLFDPNSLQILERFRVGCDPTSVAVSQNIAVVANFQGGSLSLVPLR